MQAKLMEFVTKTQNIPKLTLILPSQKESGNNELPAVMSGIHKQMKCAICLRVTKKIKSINQTPTKCLNVVFILIFNAGRNKVDNFSKYFLIYANKYIAKNINKKMVMMYFFPPPLSLIQFGRKSSLQQLQFQYQMSYNHRRQVPIQAIRNKYRNFQLKASSKSPPPGNLSAREIKRHSPININTFMPTDEIKDFREVPQRGSKTGRICKNVNKFENIAYLSTNDYRSTKSQFEKLALGNTLQFRRKGLKQFSQNRGSLKHSASHLQISSKTSRTIFVDKKQIKKGQRVQSESLRCIQNIEKVQRRIKSILLQN